MSDAIGKIYDETDWSFQRSIVYGGWLCPGRVMNQGTFTVTPYQNTVIADATATASLLAFSQNAANPFITTLQFRNLRYSIYNIIAYDDGQTPFDPISFTGSPNYPYATLTLDRPWMESFNGPGMSYMIYQCYFVSPVKDFRKFIEIRDTRNAFRLNFWTMTEAELAVRDPQRTQFADPGFVVPAGVDQRPNSATLGWPMFELWPQQLSWVPYSFSYRRRGVVPTTYNDFLTTSPPYPLTEELVRWRALEVLYQWKEAQRDKSDARGSGSNWIILSQMAQKEYAAILDKILAVDLNLNAEEFTRIEGRGRPLSNAAYSNQIGGLNIGGFPSRYR